MGFAARDLPDFPWDSLASHAERARAHPDGIVDLSVGTPVDPTPAVVREALAAAADAPGYPTTHGTPALHEAIAGWFARRRGVPGLGPSNVLPTVGSKELVAHLPSLLGLGPGDVVVHPRVAYPTYDVGARLAGATPVACDDPQQWPDGTRLVWVNSPSNPTGAVADVPALAAVVAAARARGAVVASDECYAELGWEAPRDAVAIPSVLDPRVSGGESDGLLAVYSLSKQSNLAGYRAGLVAGDPAIVGRLLEIRKHAGMIVPAPVQAAMVAALGDDDHVREQRERYRLRRASLLDALTDAGFVVEGSAAGLYLWVRAPESAQPDAPAGGTRPGAPAGPGCWRTVARLADAGILVAPGSFYGVAGGDHVRVALTATDERVAAAVERLRHWM